MLKLRSTPMATLSGKLPGVKTAICCCAPFSVTMKSDWSRLVTGSPRKSTTLA